MEGCVTHHVPLAKVPEASPVSHGSRLLPITEHIRSLTTCSLDTGLTYPQAIPCCKKRIQGIVRKTMNWFSVQVQEGCLHRGFSRNEALRRSAKCCVAQLVKSWLSAVIDSSQQLLWLARLRACSAGSPGSLCPGICYSDSEGSEGDAV